MQGRLSTPTSNDIIKRNEICNALSTTPLRNINHRVREAEKFGKGPASNTLMDIILEYIFGWYLAQQTFVSREEGEFGNQAAKLWIHFKCAVGIELSWTERSILRTEALNQFFWRDRAMMNACQNDDMPRARPLNLAFQYQTFDHFTYPHAVHSLVQEQAAKQYCLETTVDDMEHKNTSLNTTTGST